MVEVQRGANGKFAKQTSGEPQPIGAGDTGNSSEKPSGNVNGDTIIVDTKAIDAAADADRRQPDGKRGRGRPPGSGKKEETQTRPAAQGKLDLNSLNFTLFYAHSTLALATKTPELALTEEEAKNLSTACMNVMQHYNIKASQKAIDWGNLLLTAGLLYGGKIYRISERKDAEKKTARATSDNANAAFGLAPAHG